VPSFVLSARGMQLGSAWVACLDKCERVRVGRWFPALTDPPGWREAGQPRVAGRGKPSAVNEVGDDCSARERRSCLTSSCSDRRLARDVQATRAFRRAPIWLVTGQRENFWIGAQMMLRLMGHSMLVCATPRHACQGDGGGTGTLMAGPGSQRLWAHPSRQRLGQGGSPASPSPAYRTTGHILWYKSHHRNRD